MNKFARKIKRKNDKNKPKNLMCCGRKMTHKHGYDTETSETYVCEICGKDKVIVKGGAE